MSISIVTKGIICPKSRIIRSDLITASISNDCLGEPGQDCSCPINYKRGNALNLKFIVSRSGVKISSLDLNNATDIIFALKQSVYLEDSESTILKKKSLGQITILEDDQSLSEPNLLIPLSSEDMNIDSGRYYMGLCIVFDSSTKDEANLYFNNCKFSLVYISQDIIRC